MHNPLMAYLLVLLQIIGCLNTILLLPNKLNHCLLPINFIITIAINFSPGFLLLFLHFVFFPSFSSSETP